MTAMRVKRVTRWMIAGIVGVIASFVSVSAVDWRLGNDADAMDGTPTVRWCGARRPCGRADRYRPVDPAACTRAGLHSGVECVTQP